jgi:hypothetical protein
MQPGIQAEIGPQRCCPAACLALLYAARDVDTLALNLTVTMPRRLRDWSTQGMRSSSPAERACVMMLVQPRRRTPEEDVVADAPGSESTPSATGEQLLVQ